MLGTTSLSLGGCFIGSVPTPSTTLAAQGEMCEQGRCSVGVTSCHLDRCKPCPAVTSSLLLAGSSKGSLGTAQLEAWGGFWSQSLGAEGTSWCCTSIQQQHSANTPGEKVLGQSLLCLSRSGGSKHGWKGSKGSSSGAN